MQPCRFKMIVTYFIFFINTICKHTHNNIMLWQFARYGNILYVHKTITTFHMFTATITAPVIAIMTFNLYVYYLLLLLLSLLLYAHCSKRGQNRTLGRKWATYRWRRGWRALKSLRMTPNCDSWAVKRPSRDRFLVPLLSGIRIAVAYTAKFLRLHKMSF